MRMYVIPTSLMVSKISAFTHTVYLDIPYGCYTQYLLFPCTTLTDFLMEAISVRCETRTDNTACNVDLL